MKIGYVLLLVGLVSCSKEVTTPQEAVLGNTQSKSAIQTPPTVAGEENPFIGCLLYTSDAADE